MKYLGVDVGLKRVGLAISEGSFASPYKVLEVSSLKDSIEKVKHEAKINEIEKLIVGVPEGETGKMVLNYIKNLRQEGLEVEVADETLSTQNAQKLMLEMGVGKLKRRSNDSQAAAEILQNYLDELQK